VIVDTLTVALLLALVQLFRGNSTKPTDVFGGPILIAVVRFVMYAFTRKLTNRAAEAFQRELDEVSRTQSIEETETRNVAGRLDAGRPVKHLFHRSRAGRHAKASRSADLATGFWDLSQ
jgi:hypothetical protein